MKSQPKLLFISHSASRNGATLLLLHLVRWLKQNTHYHLEVLMNGSGELVSDFQAIVRTIVWRSPAPLIRVLHLTGLGETVESNLLKARTIGTSYDLTYFNTCAVGGYIPALAPRAAKVLWHIHELQYGLSASSGAEHIGRLSSTVTRFVAVSNGVRHALVSKFGVQPEKIDVVHGFVPESRDENEASLEHRRRIRAELGWPNDAFVVGGCGRLGWCKGSDIFLQIAHAMVRSNAQDGIRFLWVGGKAYGEEGLQFDYDARALGLARHCHRVSSTPNVADYYHAMDVLALTSREDAFPLVMLEAASCRLPIVCFDGSGGGPEFVGKDAGLIAPYLDLPIFVQHLNMLKNSPQLHRAFGDLAATKLKQLHLAETQAPKLLAAIDRCLSSGKP